MDYTTVAGLTCGLNCWMAKEDICRCSCGSLNHGIMRDNGGVQPERTKHQQGKLYKLVAVIGSYIDAEQLVRDDYGSWLKKVGYSGGNRYPHERMIKNLASPSQRKWREVVNVPGEGRYDDKYLVWERVDVPRTW